MSREKDAYWFRHDANAGRGLRLRKIAHIYGHWGKGVYWDVVEILREQSDYSFHSDEPSLQMLADLIGCKDEARFLSWFSDCVKMELFLIENGRFYNEVLCKNMRKWDSCKENGAQGGRKELIDELTTPSGDVIPRTPDGSHFLYLFKNVENGSYHIGKTKDLFKRRLTIRVSTKKLKIIHFVKIAESEILQILNYLRNKYKNQKTKKDWFNFSNEELAGVIEDMQNYKKTQKKATNERTIERKKTIIEEENILYNKKNIKKAEAIVGDFIRVGTDIFHGRVSEYLSNHYPKFLEQWQLNHKGAANAAVFEQLDRDYACCEFTNDRHVINTFRMVYGKIIEKSSPKYPKDTAPVYRASIPEKPKQ